MNKDNKTKERTAEEDSDFKAEIGQLKLALSRSQDELTKLKDSCEVYQPERGSYMTELSNVKLKIVGHL